MGKDKYRILNLTEQQVSEINKRSDMTESMNLIAEVDEDWNTRYKIKWNSSISHMDNLHKKIVVTANYTISEVPSGNILVSEGVCQGKTYTEMFINLAQDVLKVIKENEEG